MCLSDLVPRRGLHGDPWDRALQWRETASAKPCVELRGSARQQLGAGWGDMEEFLPKMKHAGGANGRGYIAALSPAQWAGPGPQ